MKLVSISKCVNPRLHLLLHGRTLDLITPGSGQAAPRTIASTYFGEAFTFNPSFTGGSILMLGP